MALQKYADPSLVTTENLTRLLVGKKENIRHLAELMNKLTFKENGIQRGRTLIDEKQKLAAIEFLYQYNLDGQDFRRYKLYLTHWNDDGRFFRQDVFFYADANDTLLPPPSDLVGLSDRHLNAMLESKKYKSIADVLKRSTRPCIDNYEKLVNLTSEGNDNFIKALAEVPLFIVFFTKISHISQHYQKKIVFGQYTRCSNHRS